MAQLDSLNGAIALIRTKITNLAIQKMQPQLTPSFVKKHP